MQDQTRPGSLSLSTSELAVIATHTKSITQGAAHVLLLLLLWGRRRVCVHVPVGVDGRLEHKRRQAEHEGPEREDAPADEQHVLE